MTGSLRNALHRAFCLGAFSCATLFAGALQAADVFWEGDDAGDPTDWAIPENWTGGVVPGVGDNAQIVNGNPATVSSDVGFLNEIRVGGGSRLNVNAGGLVSPDADMFFGDGAGSSGELVMSDGVVDGFDGIRIGTAGGTGFARLTGGQLRYNSSEGFSNNASFLLGVDGEGTFNLEGGELRQVTSADVGAGESWNYIGRGAGEATFNLSGGTASFNARTHISDGAAQSTVNQTGGLFEVRNHELVISDVGTGGGKGTYNISGGELNVAPSNILVGHWADSHGELNATGGTVRATNLLVGNYNNANGVVNVSGTADIQVSNEMHIGNGTGDPVARSVGVLNQSGGNIRNGGWSFIGGTGNGDGTFNLSGGTFTNADRFHVGGESGSTGVINQTGGTLRVEANAADPDNAPDMLVGDGRGTRGEFNLSGGEAIVDRDMLIGHWARSEGHVNVSGGELRVGQHMFVGAYTDTDPNDVGADGLPGTPDDNYRSNHKGFLKITDGAVRINNDLSIASDFNSDGQVDMEGGELTVGQWTYIGRGYLDDAGTIYESNGSFNMSGGQVTFEARVGIGFASNGELNQTGGRIDFTDAKGSGIAFHIGDQATGHGVYNLSGGEAVVSGGRVQIGHWRGLDATMNVSDTGILRTATEVQVGSEVDVAEQLTAENRGTLNQSGGTVDIGGDFRIGVFDRSNGFVNLTGGDMRSRQNVTVGDAGSASFTHTGGTHTIDGDLTIGVQAGSDGLYTLDGDGLLDMTGGSMSYGAGLANFAFEGGTLKDAGTINFNLINNGGTLAPGASPGVTTIVGNYEVTSADASYQVEIAGLTQGTEYDFLNVTGATVLGGNLDVILSGSGPVLGDTNDDGVVDLDDLNNVRNNFGGSGTGDTDGDNDVDLDDLNNVRNNFGEEGGGFVPDIGDSFTILASAAGVTGTFATTSFPVLPGRHFEVSYQPNDVVLNVVAGPGVVPEPGTLGLGAMLLVGAGWWIRRQKR